MNEQDYMKITGGIDERFVSEYENITERHVVNFRRRITVGIAVAAAVALMIPAGVFAFTQLTHRDKVSIYYSDEGVRVLEESLMADGFTVDNGKIGLTVDVQMCDGNFVQGVYTLTALTEDAKKHLSTATNKLVYADTGEWISPVGGGSECCVGDAMGDNERSVSFSYPVHNSYIDGSRPIRIVFFEEVKTGEPDGLNYVTKEDYTYYEGICFDLVTKPNVPVKTLCSEDGNELVLSPYCVSQLDKDWQYPENDILQITPINNVTVITADGERIVLLDVKDKGYSLVSGLGTTVINGYIITGGYGSGNFSFEFGKVFNIENISGVEINGVAYMEE